MITVHAYPDGSKRVGCPPFPKLSPIEQAAGKKEPEATVLEVEVHPDVSQMDESLAHHAAFIEKLRDGEGAAQPKRRGRPPKASAE